MATIKVLFLAPHGAIHDQNHDYLKEIQKYPDIEVTALVSPFWPYERHGTSTIRALFHKFKRIHADRYQKEDRNYKLILKTPILPGKSFHFYPHIIGILNKIKPDIIHIFGEPWYAILTQVAIWRNLFSKHTKIALYSHDNIYRPYQNRFFYNLIIYKILEDYNSKQLNGSTAVTNEVKALLRKKGVKGEIAIVGNQIDVELFRKKNVGPLKKELKINKSKVIGYFSRIEESKGILTLIDAAEKIKEKDFKLLIVGWSDDDFQNEVMERAKKKGIDKKIILITKRLGPKVVDYINCCDCVVMPSQTTFLWKEQFGRVNAEAMACEVPVIGSSSGGIPEVIGETGLVFKEGNAEDLKDKLCKFIDDDKLLKKLSKLSRKRVIDNYTTEKTAEITVNFYRSLVEKKK